VTSSSDYYDTQRFSSTCVGSNPFLSEEENEGDEEHAAASPFLAASRLADTRIFEYLLDLWEAQFCSPDTAGGGGKNADGDYLPSSRFAGTHAYRYEPFSCWCVVMATLCPFMSTVNKVFYHFTWGCESGCHFLLATALSGCCFVSLATPRRMISTAENGITVIYWRLARRFLSMM
jgi:hypothetical protein